MNNDAESVLVFFSIIFGILLFIFSVIKKPRLTFLNINTYIDISRWPSLAKFLLAVVAGSVVVGLIITRDFAVILKVYRPQPYTRHYDWCQGIPYTRET